MAIAETKFVTAGQFYTFYGFYQTSGTISDTSGGSSSTAFSIYSGSSVRELYWDTSGNITFTITDGSANVTNDLWDNMIITSNLTRSGTTTRTLTRTSATFSQFQANGTTPVSRWYWPASVITVSGNPFVVDGIPDEVEWEYTADGTPDNWRLNNAFMVASGTNATSYSQPVGYNQAVTVSRVTGTANFGISTSTTPPSSFTGANKTLNPGEYIHVQQAASSTRLKSNFTKFNAGGVTESWYVDSDAAGSGSAPDYHVGQGIYYYGFSTDASATTTQNVAASGSTMSWIMNGAAGDSNNDLYQTYLNSVTATFSNMVNCSLTYPTTTGVGMQHTFQTGVNGCILNISGAAGSTYSATATFTHGTPSAGNKTKTFTVTGVIDPSDYGLEAFNSSGDTRMSMEKRQPRYHGSVTGTGNGNSVISATYAGYYAGGSSQWHAVNTTDSSNYYVSGGSSNSITLTRADIRTASASYQVLTGNEDYHILVFRY